MHSRVLGAFFEEQHYIILYWGSDERPEEMDSAVPRSEPLVPFRIGLATPTLIVFLTLLDLTGLFQGNADAHQKHAIAIEGLSLIHI